MSNNELIKQAIQFSRARGNLLLVIVFSAVNLILVAMESSLYFPFSAVMPIFLYAVLIQIFFVETLTALVFGFLCIGTYYICWALSKKLRVFILIALIFFVADTLLYGYIFLDDVDTGFFIQAAFRVWVLFYLVTGTIAWFKLRGVTQEQISAAENEANETAAKIETETALKEITPEEVENENENT
jgi:hypothetical protein